MSQAVQQTAAHHRAASDAGADGEIYEIGQALRAPQRASPRAAALTSVSSRDRNLETAAQFAQDVRIAPARLWAWT